MLSFEHLISKAKNVLEKLDKTKVAKRNELQHIHNELYLYTPKIPGIEYITLPSGCKDCIETAAKNIRTMIQYYDTAKEQAAAEVAEELAKLDADITVKRRKNSNGEV